MNPLHKNMPLLLRKHRVFILWGTCALATLTSFLLSGEALATKIEDQLEAVHKLTTGGVVRRCHHWGRHCRCDEAIARACCGGCRDWYCLFLLHGLAEYS